jgi:hypothetical protein
MTFSGGAKAANAWGIALSVGLPRARPESELEIVLGRIDIGNIIE